MLRGIRFPYLDGELSPFQVNITGATTGVASLNAPLVSSVTTASTAADVIIKGGTPPRPFVSVATPVGTSRYGACAYPDPDPSGTEVRIEARDTSNTRQTGKVNVLSLVREHKSNLRVFPFTGLNIRHAMPRIIVARINADGTIASGKADIASVTKASSVYTITFKRAFARVPVTVASAIHASAQKLVTVAAEANNSVQIATFSRSAAEDNAFCLMVVGSDSPVQSYTNTRTIKHSFIRPRLEIARFTVSGGTWTVADGGGSVTKNGTGDITYTYPRAFSRAPVIVGGGLSQFFNLYEAPGTASCRFRTTAASSGNASDSGASLLILGWDSVREI